MIALKSFYNNTVGNIKKGKVLSERVLNCLDVKELKKAGFIGDIDDGVKVTDEVSFSSIKTKPKPKKVDKK